MEQYNIVALLLGGLAVVWALYERSQNNRDKDRAMYDTERISNMQSLIETTKEATEKQMEGCNSQILYQQTLIDNYKKDLDEVQSKYFELASTLHPALVYTNKTLEDIGRVIQKLT